MSLKDGVPTPRRDFEGSMARKRERPHTGKVSREPSEAGLSVKSDRLRCLRWPRDVVEVFLEDVNAPLIFQCLLQWWTGI
jgi:hypothetical protein